MPLFNPATDAAALGEHLHAGASRFVICYCAAWCRTCDAYQPALATLAKTLPDWTFLWVDIEDSPEWLADEDIENFPSILIQDSAGNRFWGTQPARVETLERLIASAPRLPVIKHGPGPVRELFQPPA